MKTFKIKENFLLNLTFPHQISGNAVDKKITEHFIVKKACHIIFT